MTHKRITGDFLIRITGLAGYPDGYATLRTSRTASRIARIGEQRVFEWAKQMYDEGLQSKKFKLRGGVNTTPLLVAFYSK